MERRAFILSLAGAAAITGCGGGGSQRGVDQIVVHKSKRTMTLYSRGKALKTYPIGLGGQPSGHKQFEGDGRTPEGRYRIWTKNPRSAFHLSLGISYPNQQDVAFARARGRSPGGDIFIHGEAKNPNDMRNNDWTAGCIAVTNEEIREIYRQVRVGTVIDILP